MNDTINIEIFNDKSEYKLALENFRKENPLWQEIHSDDLFDFKIGVFFTNQGEAGANKYFCYKFKEGNPEIIEYDDYALWLENVITAKIEFKNPLISCDSPRKLQIGYLSIDTGKIYKIGIRHLKRPEGAVLATTEERRFFGECPFDPVLGVRVQPKSNLPLPDMIDLVP